MDAATIEVGHSEFQVRYLLGPPHHVYRGKQYTSRGYDLAGTLEHLKITFEDGRVEAITRRSFVLENREG